MKNQPLVLIDSANGVYIPNLFANMVLNCEIKVKNFADIKYYLGDLGNTENEFYWESWDSIISKAILVSKNGTEYTLHQNDDLWCIPDGVELEEDFFNY